MKRFKFNSECDKVIAQFISQNELLKEAFDELEFVQTKYDYSKLPKKP